MSHIDKTGWSNIGGITYFMDEYQAVTQKNLTYLLGEGKEFYLQLKHEKHFLEAYNCCPPLKAIIGKRAKAFNTGETVFQNIEGRPLRGYHWLKKLLKRPNPLQNEKQFFAQQNHYVDIFGYCPVLKIRPAGMPEEISAIWNVPPWLFDIEYTRKWLNQNRVSGIYQSYKILWEGHEINIPFNDLGFVFDDGIGTECDTNLTIPDSRLVGLDYVISNIMAAYKSRNTLITKRGAIGILSSDARDNSVPIPLNPDDKEELQRDFKKYGLIGQPYHIIITNASLKWQQMGFPTKDLMLFEETTENIERLADAYGWPIELIARGKDVTYDNKMQARKDLYQNTLIPESDSRMEQFSRCLGIEGVEIRKDFSCVPVLQSDRKTMAEARLAVNAYCEKEYNAGLMTKNEWREELGLPPIEDPSFNEYKKASTPQPQPENETKEDNNNEEEPTSEDPSTEVEE